MSIRIITEPTVRLVGRLSIDDDALDHFLKDEEVDGWETDTDVAAQKLVEVAGRLCYKSYAKPRPGGNATYLGHILEVGHGSVIEHAVYNFIITGVSRSFTHELVRHRAGWAYSQRSQRFCDESELSAVVPPLLLEEVRKGEEFISRYGHGSAEEALLFMHWNGGERGDPYHPGEDVTAGLIWLRQMEYSRFAYSRLSAHMYKKNSHTNSTLRLKKAREAARSVLPNATETQIFVTVNARAARHFIEARGDEHADAEIRAVALKMLAILKAESSNLFGDYSTEDRPGVGPVITTPHRKV